MITVEFCAEADAAKPIEAMAASDGIRKSVNVFSAHGTLLFDQVQMHHSNANVGQPFLRQNSLTTDASSAGWRPENHNPTIMR